MHAKILFLVIFNKQNQQTLVDVTISSGRELDTVIMRLINIIKLSNAISESCLANTRRIYVEH